MRAAFQLFDKDGGGSIEAAEIAAVLGHDINNDNDGVWQEVIREVDSNGDGRVDFDDARVLAAAADRVGGKGKCND